MQVKYCNMPKERVGRPYVSTNLQKIHQNGQFLCPLLLDDLIY